MGRILAQAAPVSTGAAPPAPSIPSRHQGGAPMKQPPGHVGRLRGALFPLHDAPSLGKDDMKKPHFAGWSQQFTLN